MKSYYDDKVSTCSCVSKFFIFDEKGDITLKNTHTSCYSEITYHKIPDPSKTILVYQSEIPYDYEAVKRWVADLTEVGFPCRVTRIDGATYCFFIRLSDYKWKPHLNAVLALIRALFECGIDKVPELYFQALDLNPKADKFLEIQKAHKGIKGYFNTNHMVTHHNIVGFVTKEVLFERYEKTNKSIYCEGCYITQDRRWGAEFND